MAITTLQLHKRASYEFIQIQDKYAINSKARSFALADGTTQSFYSEIWADILVRDFIDNPTFDPLSLIQLFKKSAVTYKGAAFNFSTNPAKASLEKAKQKKGGTATFLGMRFLNEDRIEVIACGDTNLFIWNDKNKVVSHFPFADIDSLDSNSCFVNTEQLLAEEIDESFFKTIILKIQKGDKILLATDALSRLLLKRPELKSQILGLKDFTSFHDFCIKHWENKEMEEDDISVITIDSDKGSNFLEIIPPPNFSFPKEQETTFIPTPIHNQNPAKYSPMEMHEIKSQFNGVANDFHLVKKKLNLHGSLMMMVIILLMANLGALLWFSPLKSSLTNKIERIEIQNTKSTNQPQESHPKSKQKGTEQEPKVSTESNLKTSVINKIEGESEKSSEKEIIKKDQGDQVKS